MEVYNFGPCGIYVNTGVDGSGELDNTWEQLGYSVDGVIVREQPVMVPLYGDRYGGPDGRPIDYCYFGDTHYLQSELTRLNDAVLSKIGARFRTGESLASGGINYGQVHQTGRLVGSQHFMMLLKSDTEPLNLRRYLCAHSNDPLAFALGTKFSRVQFGFTCHQIDVGSPAVPTIWDSEESADLPS